MREKIEMMIKALYKNLREKKKKILSIIKNEKQTKHK